ncbi:MAG: flagellar assembly protein FliW [Phycisphaeraceae bacterium]
MLINTSRFGKLDVDEQRIIEFPKGILGFPSYQKYILLEAGSESYFWWLQSIEVPDLAFVVTDPSLFVPTYKVPLRGEQLEQLGIESLEQAQVFVIVNKREHVLTGNLQGPLVVHVEKRVGAQLVLSDRRFTTRVPLVELPGPVQAASA